MCSGCSATAPRIDCPISSSCITTEPSFGTLRRPWIDFLEDFGGADRRQGLLVVLTLCSRPFSKAFQDLWTVLLQVPEVLAALQELQRLRLTNQPKTYDLTSAPSPSETSSDSPCTAGSAAVPSSTALRPGWR